MNRDKTGKIDRNRSENAFSGLIIRNETIPFFGCSKQSQYRITREQDACQNDGNNNFKFAGDFSEFNKNVLNFRYEFYPNNIEKITKPVTFVRRFRSQENVICLLATVLKCIKIEKDYF